MLCVWICCPMLHAQLYCSSSATYHSYSTGGVLQAPVDPFRSTSAYIQNNIVKSSIAYSTAPIRVANGTITTVATTIQNGILADEQDYAPVSRVSGRRNTMAPPTETDPYVPLGDGWDVIVLFILLSMFYAINVRYRVKKA